MPAKRLLLPVEVKARELRAKMLLAVHAAATGWRVYIGKSGAVQTLAEHVAPSVYIDKNILPARAAHFDRVKECGHTLLAWEEEAIGIVDFDFHVASKVHGDMLARVDRFLTWGDMELAAIARRHGHLKDRLVATGNPRADVLRPEYRALLSEEAKDYNARFGSYILVLGNFNRVNAPDGTFEDYVRGASSKFRLTPETRAIWLEALQHRRRMFEHFYAAVPRLAEAFPSNTIVVRPHPGENHETWRELEAGARNVRVVYEGDAVAWIAGASAVIHNGCTTGVEAYLMGRVPIAYKPIVSEQHDIRFPNDLSLPAASLDELLAIVAEDVALQGRPVSQLRNDAHRAQRLRAASVVTAIDGDSASHRILAVCEELAPGGRNRADDIDEFLSSRARIGRSARRERVLRKVAGVVRGNVKGTSRAQLVESSQKFTSLSDDEVLHLVRGYARLANVPCPSVRLISNEIACLEGSA